MTGHVLRESPCSSRGGFTLLELLLVVIIIGILAAAVIPTFAGRAEQARIAAAKQDIFGSLGVALDLYEQDTGSYPTMAQGLGALVSEPAGVHNWHGPYLKSTVVPKDPWGNPYDYRFPSSAVPTLYELVSAGKDGQLGTNDDITNLPKE